MNTLRTPREIVFWLRLLGLFSLVAIGCYYADRVVFVLGIPPTGLASFWPATPFLVAVLLLTPRKVWPVLMIAGLGALVLADIKNGVSVRAEIWITLGNLIDALAAALGLELVFEGLPRLTSVSALIKYVAVAVILAPTVSAFVGSKCSLPGGYWLQWRLWFFADALGFLTVTPAILSWVHDGSSWVRKATNYLELGALLVLLALFGYIAFMGYGRISSPAVLYSLVGLLLWAALRLGVKGVSTAMIAVAFLATWGAALDRGPFTGQGPLNNTLSLQLFLLFAAMPFMALAAVVEEEKQDNARRKLAEETLLDSEERLRFATQAGRMFAYEWDLTTDVIVRSENCAQILGLEGDATRTTGQDVLATIHSEDREKIVAMMERIRPTDPIYRTVIRVFRPDGGLVWLERTGRGFFDPEGRLVRMIGMAVDITDRKRSEETLRESEERFRNVFRDAGVGMIIVAPDGRFLAANATFCEYLGYTEEELRQLTVQSVTQPEDWPSFSAKLRATLAAGTSFQRFEKRCRHKNGRTVYTESSASLIRTPSGEPKYLVGEVLDVTERKMAEESLAIANRRLMDAQEQERVRIARDLHDDVNQRLAMLAIELDQLVRNPDVTPTKLRERAAELFRQTREISEDIQSLSHQLHPSKIDHLGIVAAMGGFCREFGARQGLEIHFAHDEMGATVPREASVCLFRILQEALHNAAKHSGVRRFEVKLYRTGDGIGLRVSDKGLGFDLDSAKTQSGLGLVSMRERLRLIEGRLSIRTKPDEGTTIDAFIPTARSDLKTQPNA